MVIVVVEMANFERLRSGWTVEDSLDTTEELAEEIDAFEYVSGATSPCISWSTFLGDSTERGLLRVSVFLGEANDPFSKFRFSIFNEIPQDIYCKQGEHK